MRVKDELKDNSFWFGAAQLRRRIRGSNRKKGGRRELKMVSWLVGSVRAEIE